MKALLIGLIFLSGCVSGLRVKPARFTFNDRVRNTLIVNRIPRYGDTKPDGCVIEGQIYLSVKTSDNSKYIGKVQDVKTLEPLSGATIRVHLQNSVQPLIVTAHPNGEFTFESEKAITRLEVNMIGWRTLRINFKSKQG